MIEPIKISEIFTHSVNTDEDHIIEELDSESLNLIVIKLNECIEAINKLSEPPCPDEECIDKLCCSKK